MYHSALGKTKRHFKALGLKPALGLEMGRGPFSLEAFLRTKPPLYLWKLGPDTDSWDPELESCSPNLADRVEETAYRT